MKWVNRSWSGVMSGFLGSYVHQVDEKGRLSLPASFRRGVAEGPLIVVQVHEGALTLYPERAWEEVQERLLGLLRTGEPHAREYVLNVTANAVEVAPDKQGRILLPQRLLQAVRVRESALLVGVINKIEVWDPETFTSAVGDRRSDFAGLTTKVFG
jgi:MraZ protein